MRTCVSRVLLAFALFLAGLSAAVAQDWSGRWMTQGSNVTNYLDLTQTGNSVQGAVSGNDRGNLAGTVNGGTMTAAATFANGVTYTVSGTLQNDIMQLTLTAGQVVNNVRLIRVTNQQHDQGQDQQQVAVQYYYLDAANAQFGPFGLDGLRAEIGAGRLKQENLVWTAGMATWDRADAVAAIAPLFAAPDPDANQFEYWLKENDAHLGAHIGPFTFDQIRAKIQSGEVNSWTRLWRSDKDVWLRADSRKEFTADFAPKTVAAMTDKTVVLPLFAPTLTPEERRKVEMSLGAILGVLMHEIGHALIGELGMPATGPEEDVVDEFSALFLSTMISPKYTAGEDAGTVSLLYNMVHYSTLMWRRVEEADARAGLTDLRPWYDSHSSPANRFRNILCLVYGSNPDHFKTLADTVQFPEQERINCTFDYPRRLKAWETIMAPYMRDLGDGNGHANNQPANTPGAKVTVDFRPSLTATGQLLLPVFEQSGIFAGFGPLLEQNFVWPRDFELVFADCGQVNAFYNPEDAHVIMCWEGIEDFAGTILDAEGVARH